MTKACNDLIKKYPHLYADPYPEDKSPKYCMQLFGFETDDGWYDILDRLSQKITDYLEEHPIEGFLVHQVKEKFGLLSFYMSHYEIALEEIINEAEDEAAQTCEKCGSKEGVATRAIGGWLNTWCKKCYDIKHTELIMKGRIW